MTRRIALAVVLGVLSSEASAQQPPAPLAVRAAPAATSLRFRYTPGQRVTYRSRTEQILGGAGRAPPSVTTATLVLETLRVDPAGTAEQRMRITRFGMTGRGVPASVQGELSRAMEGLVLEYAQDPRGVITPRPLPTTTPQNLRPVLDAVRSSLEQMSPALPERPVAVGDRWTDHRTLHVAPGAAALDLVVDTTYELRELGAGAGGPASRAVVQVSMTFRMPTGAQLATIPLTGGGDATGTMTLDLARGALTASEVRGTLRMTLAAAGRDLAVSSQFQNELRVVPP